MANPFLRRATEYVREDESFLSIVSPAPLTTFLATSRNKDDVFEVPVRIIGAPGSGKTMLATLAEFRMVETILKDETNATNRTLADALAQAGFLKDGRPSVAAVRVPMESEYREFWELPYDPIVKTKLAFWLVQARAMLGLIRNLIANRTREIDAIEFIPRADYEAHVEQIGGLSAAGIRDRALAVQRAIYSVGAGLRAPKLEDLPIDATAPYAPFDVISRIRIEWNGENIDMSPLVMLDDVHALHHDQLEAMFGMLSHREMKFGRWMMMRLDALSPGAVMRSPASQPTHNRATGRDFLDIRMQGDEKKDVSRRQFRTMARDMAKRYLPMVEGLRNRNATDIDRLVPSQPPKLTPGQIRELESRVTSDQNKLKIGPTRRKEIDGLVGDFISRTKSYDDGPEVALAMKRILLHRYAIRIARSTPSLFEEIDPDPKTPLKADADVAHGARLHLHHEFGRPLHYGVDDVCDASNENAEIFLQFAGALVANIETRAIRNNPLALPAREQQSILIEKAKSIMDAWAFPNAQRVRDMVDAIGNDCREESLLPNAPLGAGANAIAILEEEMEALPLDDELGSVLKHAIANGAITIERNYGQGSKLWALIELTGTVGLVYGLTFNRGGFLPQKIDYLRKVTGWPMRKHWDNCISNFDEAVDGFVADYFADPARRALLVAAAGFDPRSRRISQMLSSALGNRLSAVFIREERAGASTALIEQADENEKALRSIVPDCTIFRVDVFADDGAPVGGSRIVSLLGQHPIADEVTDIILDLSALSIGIGFPAAKMLLEDCEAASNRAFHLMIVSNPEMDDRISSVPSSRAGSVKGFSPPVEDEGQGLAQVWIPQLARGRTAALTQIGAAIGRWYKICPLLPFPARNPRRADDLLSEYQTALVDEWEVDPRDVVYASERNPLDCYRTLSTLKTRFDRTMKGTYEPRMVLSPVGSKVLAAGALMAAIEHDMAVQYLETESYLFDRPEPTVNDLPDMTVHLILCGPLYAGYEDEDALA